MRSDRIGLVILLQFALLAIDVTLNIMSELYGGSPVTLLLFFIIQDFCIVSSLLVMCLAIFNTYAFQVGQFKEVATMFKTPVAVNLVYLVLSLVLHVWSMDINEDGSAERLRHSWQTKATDVTLFTLQRFGNNAVLSAVEHCHTFFMQSPTAINLAAYHGCYLKLGTCSFNS
uniref:Transmembrane protein 138 n=1 Tax=Rhipicephalus microplus TaxID=6941 RepID=A0A6M2D4U7_RHIMP